jgi:DNA primase
MAISKESIDRVKDQIEIAEVIGDFVSLKRKGQNLWACCPFHQEKSPSFSVSPAKQIFKCFGCGKAGDAITFIEEIEGLNYIEAIRYLADKYGIEIEEKEESPAELLAQNERESLFIALQHASELYHKQLLEDETGRAIGLSYFRERGFSDATIKKFQLGYSPEEWSFILDHAKNFSPEILEKAGLILKSEEGRTYDRFRARVMFPIFNTAGKVVGFGGRTLSKDKKQAKYINSPESPVYHKSKILYGLFQSRQSIRAQDLCYLVEGYTDVISMHQAGVENVVASSGTSLTEDQIKLISRYTQNVTVLFDGDAAGIKASLRGIDMLLEQNLDVRVVIFPDGEDPDSYSKKVGSQAFTDYLAEHARDFISFKTDLFVQDTKGDPIKKAGVIKDIVESISKVPDAIKRSVYIKECSRLLEVDEGTLIAELNKVSIRKNKEKKESEEQLDISTDVEAAIGMAPTQYVAPDPKSKISIQEKESIRLLINYGNVALEDGASLAEFIIAGLDDQEFYDSRLQKLRDMYVQALEGGHTPDSKWFLDHTQGELKNLVIELVTQRREISENWARFEIFIPKEEDILDKAVLSNLLRLKFRTIQKQIKENLEIMKDAQSDCEIIACMNTHTDLKQIERELANRLGIVVSG